MPRQSGTTPPPTPLQSAMPTLPPLRGIQESYASDALRVYRHVLSIGARAGINGWHLASRLLCATMDTLDAPEVDGSGAPLLHNRYTVARADIDAALSQLDAITVNGGEMEADATAYLMVLCSARLAQSMGCATLTAYLQRHTAIRLSRAMRDTAAQSRYVGTYSGACALAIDLLGVLLRIACDAGMLSDMAPLRATWIDETSGEIVTAVVDALPDVTDEMALDAPQVSYDALAAKYALMESRLHAEWRLLSQGIQWNGKPVALPSNAERRKRRANAAAMRRQDERRAEMRAEHAERRHPNRNRRKRH